MLDLEHSVEKIQNSNPHSAKEGVADAIASIRTAQDAFTKANDEIDYYVRTISQTSIIRDPKDINKLIITFVGTGFMRYMVRNMIGFLIEVGEGKRKPEEIINILKKEDRTLAGKTAPACGLYLRNVFY